MKAYDRISIKQIMDDILDHPMMQDLSFERAINYAIEFIRIVGMPDAFEHKTQEVDIENYIAEIPADCYQLLAVKTEGNEPMVLNASTSVYGVDTTNKNYLYTIKGNTIHTALNEGKLILSYLSLPVDEEGYPTIPDMASYIRALELYIKKKWFTILFDLGKLNVSIFNNVRTEYAWAVGQAQTELIRPSTDEMQAFTNMWTSLLPRSDAHKHGFATLGSKEINKI